MRTNVAVNTYIEEEKKAKIPGFGISALKSLLHAHELPTNLSYHIISYYYNLYRTVHTALYHHFIYFSTIDIPCIFPRI